MAGNKKPKKAYRPRVKIDDPLQYVLSGLVPVRAMTDISVSLRIQNHGALVALSKGCAKTHDITRLIDALNVSEALALGKIGAEYAGEIAEGQAALKAIGARGRAESRYLLRGPELSALNVAVEVHDAQLEVATVNDMEKAINLINKTVRAGRAEVIITSEPRDRQTKELSV